MANESKIKIVVVGESSGAKKSLDSVEKEVKDVGKASKDVSKSLKSSFSSMDQSVGKLSQSFKSGLGGGLGNLKNSVNGLGGSFSSLSGVATIAAGAIGGLVAGAVLAGFAALKAVVTSIVTGIRNLGTRGIKAVEDFRGSITSIAASFVTFGKNIDETNLEGEFERAKQVATDLIPIIENLASTTLLSGDQVRVLVEEFTKGGQILDSNNKQQISSIKNISNALGILLGDMANEKQIRQEIGDLYQGQITAASTLGQVLKSRVGNNVKQILLGWKEQGVLIERVGQEFAAFGVASKDLENSLSTVKSTLDTTVNQILREGLSTLNDGIVQSTKDWNQVLLDNKEALVALVSLFASAARIAIKIALTIKTMVVEVIDFVKLWSDGIQIIQKWELRNNHVIEQNRKIREEARLVGGQISENARVTESVASAQNKVSDALSGTSSELRENIETNKNVAKEVDKVRDAWQGIIDNLQFEIETEGLSDTAKQIRKIQNEVDELTAKYGAIPEVIKGSTLAITKLINKQKQLNAEAARTGELQAQQTIADLSKNTQERIVAITALSDAERQSALDRLNDQLKNGVDSTTAERAFALEKEKISKDLNEEIKKVEGEKWDFLNDKQKESIDLTKSANEEISDLGDFDTSSFDTMNDSLRESASLSDRVSRNLDDSSKKAKQFGSALSLDTVGSLALERNLRFAGRGTLPSRNIANAGVAGFGVQSIVPESFQQESRMRALQEVLSQESNLAGSSGFSQEQIQGLRNELQEKFGIGGFGGDGQGDTNINNVYNISANDASSFRMSQGQILAEQNRVLDQSTRRKRGLVGGSR